jgi:hypothetical protein
VDEIPHQTPPPDLKPETDRRLAQFIEVIAPILVVKEDLPPPVAPVGDMVRETWNDSTCESSHALSNNVFGQTCQALFSRLSPKSRNPDYRKISGGNIHAEQYCECPRNPALFRGDYFFIVVIIKG